MDKSEYECNNVHGKSYLMYNKLCKRKTLAFGGHHNQEMDWKKAVWVHHEEAGMKMLEALHLTLWGNALDDYSEKTLLSLLISGLFSTK